MQHSSYTYRVHASVAVAAAARVQVFDVCAAVIPRALFTITENGIRFRYIFELGLPGILFGFFTASVLDGQTKKIKTERQRRMLQNEPNLRRDPALCGTTRRQDS